MMQTVFLSDVHLDEQQPHITKQLLAYLDNLDTNTERLFILGDLFEAWIGDDAPSAIGTQVIECLARVSARGIDGYFMHGNRDFLVGDEFAVQSGFKILPDSAVIDCYGESVLILHGDTLCTEDIEYQKLRVMVRNPDWQKQILSLDVEQRLALAKQMRDASKDQMQNKSEQIMDVNQQEVERMLDLYQVKTMLHGHTHRPNIHRFTSGDQVCTRIVLGDWYQQGSVVTWSKDGYELSGLERTQ